LANRSRLSQKEIVISEPPFVIVAGAGDERVTRFRDAVAARGGAEPIFCDYRDLLGAPEKIARQLRPGQLVRLDSPGENTAAWSALLAFGRSAILARRGAAAPDTAADEMIADPCLLYQPQLRLMHEQAYLGMAALAHSLSDLCARAGAVLLHDPEAIACCGDKAQCHAAMEEEGLCVPQALRLEADDFDALLAAMARARLPRVFVKLRFGSAAAGVVALAVSQQGLAAYTSVELVGEGDDLRLYNRNRVVRLHHARDIRTIVNAVLAMGAHVEQWIAKATFSGRSCDIRLLVVNGRAAHAVGRAARGPITNLHLGGKRFDARAAFGALPVFAALAREAERFAARFPRALYLAFDVAIDASQKRHRFLEANAFGDLIRRVLHEGDDPYGAQLRALPAWLSARGDKRRIA
jgi:glutathione synthase/RimK-type ligase-like ATP-grasp enzyme